MWVIHTWPTVLHRVLEKKEPLRKGAEDDGVSHETRRRVVRADMRVVCTNATIS